MSQITFIIPTIGRETLNATINSILSQTCPKWKAIIVFDGLSPSIEVNDPRFQILQVDKTERHKDHEHSAGYVRNYGIKFATTEWVAFIDDDDTIKNTYVETFLSETKQYDIDVIIFRMIKHSILELRISEVRKLIHDGIAIIDDNDDKKHNIMEILDPDMIISLNTHKVLPSNTADKLCKSDVGISFATKKRIFDIGIQFETSAFEDFELLEKIRQNNYKMMLSPHILYFVGTGPIDINIPYNRLFINDQTYINETFHL